jgi:hypothetical protein
MRSAVWLLALVSGLASGLAQADASNGCSPAIEKALRSVDPKAIIQGSITARHCKPWPPAEASQTAAVMAFEQPGRRDEGRSWTIVLALVDNATHQVLSSDVGEAGEDATTSVAEYSLTLDTARYQLTLQLRALGVRFRSSSNGSPAAEGWTGNELTLFVPEGRTLRPVFTKPMSAKQADVCCLSSQFPGGHWVNAEMTLAVGPAGPAAAHGWNDLVITETTVEDGTPPAKINPTPRKHRYVYRYDGKTYKLLDKPAPFWDSDGGTVAW